MNTPPPETEGFRHVHLAPAEIACIGGAAGVRMGDVTMISEQKRIRTIRHIQTRRHELYGATGISRENRHTGAVEVYHIQNIIARNS